MKPPRLIAALAFSALALTSPPHPSPAAAVFDPVQTGDAAPDELSVMTYNVKGLPFPAALARGDALANIGHRLARLRRAGKQPHVIALQEAFTSDAKAIAALAGYRYVAIGPQPDDRKDLTAEAMPAPFRAGARWLKGETEGKWIDSGLVILSDYPIRRSARMAFPADTCAGFDCLAAKGVLVAWIDIPGLARPVAIADTHLNSRKASGVSPQRADAAYDHQLGDLHEFLRQTVAPETALVFTGDFNIGHSAPRRAAAQELQEIFHQDEATLKAEQDSAALASPDIAAVLKRGKDKQFFRPGQNVPLRFESMSVPFGLANGAYDLSDHLGFVVHYALNDSPATGLRAAR
jgi:endonuclease/exonuclease/phosphatase family metal-dependent hydrolase